MNIREHAVKQLNRQFIYKNLPESMRDKLSSLTVFESISSTNEYLLENAKWDDNKFIVCIANQQTAGRGRNGKEWVSPPDANIYLSLAKILTARFLGEMQGLSLACGVAIARILYDMGVEVGIKWPNDILLNDKKLAGILTETRVKENQLMVVVGVGLNINMPNHTLNKIGQPWTDLNKAMAAGKITSEQPAIDRNLLAAKLLSELMDCIMHYSDSGFAAFEDDWNKFDVLKNRNVIITTDTEEFNATVLGINEDYSLKVEVNHQEKTFYAADIKLKV